MELKQYLIQKKFQKAEAANQITIGEDYSLPEGKPDMAKILQTKEELRMEDVHPEKGKVKIRGKLEVQVLYLAERSAQMAASLEMEFPFEESLYIEGAATGDHLEIDWCMEEWKVSMIHPGKLSVRGLVNLRAVLTETQSHQVTETLEGDSNTHTKTENLTMAEVVLERKDSYRIRDEVVLPVNKPNVSEILWKDLQLRGLELRVQEGRVAVKGEVLFLVVYEGEEDQTMLQWLEQTIPFQGTLEVPGLAPEMFGILETEISHQNIELKPDYDGEMRMFQMEMLLDVHMHIYEEHSRPVLRDAYNTKEQLQLQRQEISYEKLRMCNYAKCRVSGQEHLEDEPGILQILGQHAQFMGKTSKVTDQGIVREGTLEVQVLYVTANDRMPLGSMTVRIPYSQLIEIPEMKKEDRWKVSEILEQVFVSMPNGNQIEVRGVIGMNACVLEQCRLQNITDSSVQSYDVEEYKKRPGMVIHFVQPKESLWEIAKENRTTMEEIKKMNELVVEEVVPGQKLLLIKPALDTLIS